MASDVITNTAMHPTCLARPPCLRSGLSASAGRDHPRRMGWTHSRPGCPLAVRCVRRLSDKRDIKIERATHLMHFEAMRFALYRESICFLMAKDQRSAARGAAHA